MLERGSTERRYRRRDVPGTLVGLVGGGTAIESVKTHRDGTGICLVCMSINRLYEHSETWKYGLFSRKIWLAFGPTVFWKEAMNTYMGWINQAVIKQKTFFGVTDSALQMQLQIIGSFNLLQNTMTKCDPVCEIQTKVS